MSKIVDRVLSQAKIRSTVSGHSTRRQASRAMMRDQEMKELLGKTLGNYHLQRILGRGRMGVVFLAQDRALLRPTALKILAWSLEKGTTQDPVKWFLSEARSVARISHPNVIQIYNIAKHGRYRYIAMEYVKGASVEQTLLKKGKFSVKLATDLLFQTSAALDAAHECGVIHRDIKPANLLLRSDGLVKLSDFGMALSTYSDNILNAAMRVGTPYFNAPETWAGHPATPASDIYALGVTYFLLLTGKLPFQAKNIHELQWKHIHEPTPDPRKYVPNLPSMCKKITDVCLAKNPQRRYATATDLASAARELLDVLENDQTKISYPPSATITEPPVPIIRTGYEAITESWQETLRFSASPFSSVDPLDLPYEGPPFSTTLDVITEAVSQDRKLVLVHGDTGSGKSTLCRRHALQFQPRCRVIYLSGQKANYTFSPLAELYRYAGLDPNTSGAVEDLISWLNAGPERKDNNRTLIYLDDFPENDHSVKMISDLAKLVNRTENCTLLVASETRTMITLDTALVNIDTAYILLRPLEPREVVEYIRAWIQRTLLPAAPLLLVSTDACLLTAYIASGNLIDINRIAKSILRMGAVTNRKVISTWEVWNSGNLDTDVEAPPTHLPERPSSWPLPEVTKILNEYRLQAGFSALKQVSKPTELTAEAKDKLHE